jgi:hypothetical protein
MITGGRTRSRTSPDNQDHELQLEYQKKPSFFGEYDTRRFLVCW